MTPAVLHLVISGEEGLASGIFLCMTSTCFEADNCRSQAPKKRKWRSPRLKSCLFWLMI